MFKTIDTNELINNYPTSYYQTIDASIRYELLTNFNDNDTKERLAIFNIRYTFNNGKYNDNFLMAFINIKSLSTTKPNILTKKHDEKLLKQELDKLLIFNNTTDYIIKEWQNFALTWINISANSNSYRSAIFGMVNVGDKNTAIRMANDIKTITIDYPSYFNLKNQCITFSNTLIDTYINTIENGKYYWEETKSK